MEYDINRESMSVMRKTRKRKNIQNGGTSEATALKRSKVEQRIYKSRENTEPSMKVISPRKKTTTHKKIDCGAETATNIKLSIAVTSPRKKTMKYKKDECGTETDTMDVQSVLPSCSIFNQPFSEASMTETLARQKTLELEKDNKDLFGEERKECKHLDGESHIGSDSPQISLASIKEHQLETENETKDDYSYWNDCIQSKDAEQIRHLLRKGSLPNRKMLQYAYNVFRKKNIGLLKEICLKIEEHITSKDENIVSINACHKADREEQIVFVVLTKGKDHLLNTEYPFLLIRRDDYDGDKVIDRELQEELSFDGDEYLELTDCLRKNSPDLMEKHSNLAHTSISHFKSSKDGLNKTSCVVFYVFAKGYIPIGEELLPLYLKSQAKLFPTDVREGQFAVASGGPDEMHTDLKIGCRIESYTSPDGGTIGAFIKHPEHGLCAITCSHVLLDIDRFQKLYARQITMDAVTGEQCFQAKQPDICGNIVDVKLFGTNERNYGMDIAFVKVDENRKPKTNNFPDILRKDLTEIPTKYLQYLENLLSTFQYKSTAVKQRSDVAIRDRLVVKYGFKTKLTLGKCAIAGVSARLEFDAHGFTNQTIPRPVSKRGKFVIADQIEIRDIGVDFSAPGDSGAMVFIKDEKTELSALGILTGRNDKAKITYITPIWNILEEIEMPLPYSLAINNPVSEVLDRLEGSVDDLKKHLNA
ncbi:uncharacterized protein LOC123554735 isoform X2 [Mercenaria mercenaria]|uniref:uncharacterized protein LOC123554735 isoform X2 n=1 Tax=Mercenaria mercenaria TaxID=6596 RepID=UPI00234F9162|nr:uncharacterized protein LOC123554735 isoform X2 [Mercenaria mercenaria]